MVALTPRQYVGKPHRCGNKVRYRSNYACVTCHRAKLSRKRADPNHLVRFSFRLSKARRQRGLKVEVLSRHGPNCRRCGEDDLDVLTIDHTDQKGADYRRLLFPSSFRCGTRFCSWLKRNKFPKGFRTLCYNCNVKVFHPNQIKIGKRIKI